MSREVNAALREHVTSVGFALTLSKAQIHFLVLLAHFDGHGGLLRAAGAGGSRDYYGRNNYVSSVRALGGRGLVSTDGGRLTKAGEIVTELLKEAGLYQDTLERLGINDETKVAS